MERFNFRRLYVLWPLTAMAITTILYWWLSDFKHIEKSMPEPFSLPFTVIVWYNIVAAGLWAFILVLVYRYCVKHTNEAEKMALIVIFSIVSLFCGICLAMTSNIVVGLKVFIVVETVLLLISLIATKLKEVLPTAVKDFFLGKK